MENDAKMNLSISIADAESIHAVYHMRHDVYASELGQYEERMDALLPDASDINSIYITASVNGELAGFVGVTPPNSPRYSLEKYLSRNEIPIVFDDRLYEIRTLTVKGPFRGTFVAGSLMYAAFRWVEAHGGTQIISAGRREVLDMYQRLGLKRVGLSFKSGAVNYDLMNANITEIADRLKRFGSLLHQMERQIDWRLGVAFKRLSGCYHGGAFFNAIGNKFDDLSRKGEIISADVLDAWYPPAPAARQALSEQLSWIMRTSPPTQADGLQELIAEARAVAPECILTGGGSSDLIFLAFRHWLTPSSRVLVLDPTYGEYAHVLKNIVKCSVERFMLNRREGYRLNLNLLAEKLSEGFDLFVWVNPNNPTGLHVAGDDAKALLSLSSACRRVWLDETYVEYAGPDQSLESFAVQSDSIVVCKSLSKIYALSGLRVGYVCASPHQIEELRLLTPPWSVSLPAQIAAAYALQSQEYYAERIEETRLLREELAKGLRSIGITEIIPGVANFLMFHLPPWSCSVECVVKGCRRQGLYLRDLSGIGSALGPHAMRMAVKDADTNQRMLKILGDVLAQNSGTND